MSHDRLSGFGRLPERPVDAAIKECFLRVLPRPGRSPRQVLLEPEPRLVGLQIQKGELPGLPQSRQQRKIRVHCLLGKDQTRPRLNAAAGGSARKISYSAAASPQSAAIFEAEGESVNRRDRRAGFGTSG